MSKRNKFLLFLVIFSVSVIFTYPAFIPEHAFDSYCTMCNGYQNTALAFLKNGKIFSALLFAIYSYLNLPFDSMSFVSAFFTDFIITIVIIKLYFYIISFRKIEGLFKNIILCGAIFLLFFNPLFVEILLYDDAFIIALGILFYLVAAKKILDGNILNYIFSLLFILLGLFCYSSLAIYLFIFLLIILMSSKDSIRKILFNLVMSFAIYVLGLFLYVILLKLFGINLGNFDFVKNLIYTFNTIIPNSYISLFGFVSPLCYYLVLIIILFVCLYYIYINKNHKINTLYLMLISFSTAIFPFIYFIVIGTNYVSASMCLPLCSMPALYIIFLILRFDNFNQYLIGGTVIIVFIFFFYIFHQDLINDFKRYKNDIKYIKEVNQRIVWHENKSGNKVKEIYFARDIDFDNYYDFGNENEASERVSSNDKYLICAFKVYFDRKIKISKMNDYDYNKYFKNKNYKKMDAKEFIYDGEKLYLLIY